ncbi:hypothetical protein VAE115_270104 [Vibrio aestuarianus]|nr:hypothetical protein VAE115_270104 [Vibrio aestuarianus]CAH8194842.1 hypothetical protein VAEKB19_3230035 [Vibrio aestuarianus]CAH8223916.1 hypothetical protein VAEU17_4290195 [Vibrio aestuarianus]
MLPFLKRNTTVICVKLCNFATYVRVLQLCVNTLLIHIRITLVYYSHKR